jgi:membrane protease YdiL (CAAX protease family)
MDSPFLQLLVTAAGLYGKLWLDDRRTPSARALPGAAPAPAAAVIIAIAGGLLLLAAETLGEQALGLSAQQSHMTWLFGLYSVAAAPIIEELVFRGYLVIEGRGRTVLWAGAAGASLGFAVLHPFLWRWDAAGFALTLTAKGWFSAAAVFATSLWLYAARFARWNPARSLLPCFAAHAAKNLGVLVIKAAMGYVGPLW